MKPTPGNALLEPPAPGQERVIAHKVYAAPSTLYQRLLDYLVGRPSVRYNELKRLLHGRNNNLLTKALHRLQLEGLVVRRGFGETTAGYELTLLGVAVRDVIVELRHDDRHRHDDPTAPPVGTPTS